MDSKPDIANSIPIEIVPTIGAASTVNISNSRRLPLLEASNRSRRHIRHVERVLMALTVLTICVTIWSFSLARQTTYSWDKLIGRSGLQAGRTSGIALAVPSYGRATELASHGSYIEALTEYQTALVEVEQQQTIRRADVLIDMCDCQCKLQDDVGMATSALQVAMDCLFCGDNISLIELDRLYATIAINLGKF